MMAEETTSFPTTEFDEEEEEGDLLPEGTPIYPSNFRKKFHSYNLRNSVSRLNALTQPLNAEMIIKDQH